MILRMRFHSAGTSLHLGKPYGESCCDLVVETVRPNALTDLCHEYLMLNYPHVKEFGSKISRREALSGV